MATVREAAPAVSKISLPATGNIVDVFTADGQGYIREAQKELTPWLISVAGYRWHNRVSREFAQQILRNVTIRKGGVFAHWDALALRSKSGVQQLLTKFAASHAHSAGKHQGALRDFIVSLFLPTPEKDIKLRFVKEEVFGIENGAPIMDDDHPAIVEMFNQRIIGALCPMSMNLSSLKFNNCVLRTGNFQAKILFENKDSQAKGETTVLQNRAHPSQQKFFELLGSRVGTRELQIVLCSLFHIFTHTPVGIPTVYVQLEFQLCPYCNVTLNPF